MNSSTSEVRIKIDPSIGSTYTVLLDIPDTVIQGGSFAVEEFIDKWLQEHAVNVMYWEIDNT